MDEKSYILNYTLGDPSGDGHGISKEGQVKCNHTNYDLVNAMAQFKEKTGCNWECWCKGYEDSRICDDDTAKVLEYFGIDTKLSNDELEAKVRDYFDDVEYFRGHLCLDADSFVELMMRICQVAIPDLKWERVVPESDGEAFFTSMGYGLFYN